MRKLRPGTAERQLRKLTPEWGQKHVEAALSGNAEAVNQLVWAAHNGERGKIMRVLWRAGIAPAALRAGLDDAWNHDHARVWKAFGVTNLIQAFRDACFPVDHLPETLTVWRGEHHPDAWGFSWTLDRGLACSFALRFEGIPLVRRVVAKRSEVLAHITARNENEIVLDVDAWFRSSIDGDQNDWAAERERWAKACRARLEEGTVRPERRHGSY